MPVYLAEKGICRFIAASDINKGPLSSAIRTAKERNAEDDSKKKKKKKKKDKKEKKDKKKKKDKTSDL